MFGRNILVCTEKYCSLLLTVLKVMFKYGIWRKKLFKDFYKLLSRVQNSFLLEGGTKFSKDFVLTLFGFILGQNELDDLIRDNKLKWRNCS